MFLLELRFVLTTGRRSLGSVFRILLKRFGFKSAVLLLRFVVLGARAVENLADEARSIMSVLSHFSKWL